MVQLIDWWTALQLYQHNIARFHYKAMYAHRLLVAVCVKSQVLLPKLKAKPNKTVIGVSEGDVVCDIQQHCCPAPLT
jgi:hypothetical protein